MLPKIEVEIVVADALIDDVIKAIMAVARTGQIGDGRVFILHVDDSYRIRTGERERD
jgi:nitrogen regulatory protein P-II 1